MKLLKIAFLVIGSPLLFVACHPHIYEFNVRPKSIGPNDPVQISWNIKGVATLQIRDINYPGSGNVKLAPLNLTITQDEMTKSFHLNPDSTLIINLTREDSLLIRKNPDNNIDDRLRYITLVVTRNNQDSSRVVQVAVRPDSASDEIAFRTIIRGDSLIASGINNPIRWGNSFDILTVKNQSNRVIDVWHSNVTSELKPGDQPDKSFQGTPVKGGWTFSTIMSSAEKNDHSLVPNFLKLSITIKHH